MTITAGTQREVALKVLSADFAKEAEWLQRFEPEANARSNHETFQ
jgi:hypothetical protein